MLGVTVAALMVKLLLTALTRPVADATSCLFVPAALTWRLVNVTVPLPALVPTSSAVVPASDPGPLVKAKDTVLLAPRPTAELFPNWSWLRRAGCGLNGE